MPIAGHRNLRSELRSLAGKELIPQSYLFVGPRGIGKKLVALEFAALLIGTSPDEVEHHPDLCLLGPARSIEKEKIKKKRISITDMREAALFLSRYPTRGRRRVLILDEAHELSTEAANALLKLLEEPNETSILILITHRPGALLPTLISRLITFSFGLLSESELRTFFGKRAADIPDFFFSLGVPSLLMRALDEKNFLSHKDALGKLFQISRLTLRERLAFAEELALDEEELELLLEEWLLGLHARVTAATEPRSQAKLLLLFESLLRNTSALIRREGNARLLLEEMFLSL